MKRTFNQEAQKGNGLELEGLREEAIKEIGTATRRKAEAAETLEKIDRALARWRTRCQKS